MARKKFEQNDNNLAIVYCRYSSSAQNELSIDQQKEAAERFADSHGYRIIKVYEDKAISGTTDERPGFQLMLSEVKKLRPSVLITWKSDRIARDKMTAVMAKHTIRAAGCSIRYIAEPMPDEDTPEGKLMETLFEGLAQFTSDQMSVNIRRGVHYNADHALYNGRKILGYAGRQGEPYQVDPATAPVVERIFHEYADGKPMAELARELNEQGLRTSRGGLFTVNGLRSVLHNEAYIGVYKHSGRRIEGGMPQIIERDVFDRAQRRFAENKRKGAQRAHGVLEGEAPRYWLTGKLFCGHCGCGMRGTHGTSKTGAKHYYYACAEHQRHKCGKRNVRKADVEDVVVWLLSALLRDQVMLASLADAAADYYEKCSRDTSYLDSLMSSLKDTQKALDNLVRAIEQGIFSESTQARLEELEERKRALSEAIEVEKAKSRMVDDKHTIGAYFKRYANSDLDDPDVRDELLEHFIDKIYVYDDRLIITGWFTENPIYTEQEFYRRGGFDVSFKEAGFEPFAPISTNSRHRPDLHRRKSGLCFAVSAILGKRHDLA